jgi:glycosyltransferase involved in cell wall biosynthesis
MRITILQGPFLPVPPLRGGAVEKMWFRLGAEFADRGHQVTHISRQFDGLLNDEQIGRVHHLRVRGADRPVTRWRQLAGDLAYAWRAAARAPDGDVIVTHTFWAPVLLRRRHGAIYVDVQRMPKGQLRLYRRAARLRANSSAVAAAIVAELPAARPRVRTIPNPLSFIETDPVNWDAKKKTVLFAGRLHPEKGIELLLESWQLIQRKGSLPGWKLALVGPERESEGGGGETWVRGLRARFAAPDVEWHPPIYDEAELGRTYAQATVFVYPSLAERGETFGVAVLEAMAAGTTPVVSDLACFRDLVVSGRNGLIFDHRGASPAADLASAIERAARSDAHALAIEAVKVRETHAGTAIADQFLADFAKLI